MKSYRSKWKVIGTGIIFDKLRTKDLQNKKIKDQSLKEEQNEEWIESQAAEGKYGIEDIKTHD